MTRFRRLFLLAALVAVIAYVFIYVIDKERTISDGQLVLLELAPVDPRSLMQGDYMELRYALMDDLDRENLPTKGYLIVSLDEHSVGQYERIQENAQPFSANEFPLFFRRRSAGAMSWRSPIIIGAESYFFQEGDAEKYTTAEYGGLRVDQQGQAVLVGLWGEDRKRIE